MAEDRVGTGDERFETDAIDREDPELKAPSGEPEAAYRHRHHAEAEMPEIRSTQLIPGPLDDHDEPSLQEPQTIKFHQRTSHRSK